VIFGVYQQNEGPLIRDLRRPGPRRASHLLRRLLPAEGLVAVAGPPARGMYFGVCGVPNGELPPTGLRFLEDYEAAQVEHRPLRTLRRTARRQSILLDAIARSDGTRASVTQELRRRAVGPREPSSAILAGFEGIAFDRVVTARAALLR
jgi:hypothetical protein